MAGAARKQKLTTYNVTVKRSLEVEMVLTVDARSAEEAEGIVDNMIEAQPELLKAQVFASSTKARVKR